MHFTKMQGLGNDYLYVYGEPESPESLSVKLSDRHFGPGSDGMIWISPSPLADFRMRIFNADGSEAKMCGNGIRCVGKYVYEKGYTDKTKLTVETLSGVKNLELQVAYGKVRSVTVEMGRAAVSPERTASASLGPTPETLVISSNTSRSALVAKPKRSCASSRTSWCVNSFTRSPSAGRRSKVERGM